MKLNESFVKRMMTLAGNSDYSDRFITEAKKNKSKKDDKKKPYGRSPKKEAVCEEEEEEGEVLHDAEDAELEYEGDEDEMEVEGDEDEMDDEGSVESDDRFGDLEDDFDVEEVGGEEESPSMGKDSVVQVDAEKLVKDIVDALTKSLGDVVKLKDYSPLDDLDMEDEDEDLDMEDEDFDMEDEDEDLEGPELKESVVSELLSRKIAQSVFESLKKKGVVKKKSKKDEKPVKMSKKGSSSSDKPKGKKELDDSYIMKKRKFGFGDLEEAKDKSLHTDDREQIERSRKPYTKDERDAAYNTDLADNLPLASFRSGGEYISGEAAAFGRVTSEAQRQKYVNEFLKKEPEDQKKDLKAIYLCSVNADHRFQLPNDLKNLCAEKRKIYKEWKMGDFKLILKKMKTAADSGKTKLPVENITKELSKATKSFEKKTY